MRKERADSKTEFIVRRAREYLSAHREDPGAYPVEVRAIARWVPCSHRLFYKSEPALVALLDEITAAKRAAVPMARDGMVDLGRTDDEMARAVGQGLERALWAARRFVSQRERAPDVADAPLALYDLDTLASSLRAIAEELRPTVAALQRRREDELAGREPAPAVEGSQASFL